MKIKVDLSARAYAMLTAILARLPMPELVSEATAADVAAEVLDTLDRAADWYAESADKLVELAAQLPATKKKHSATAEGRVAIAAMADRFNERARLIREAKARAEAKLKTGGAP